MWAMWLVLGCIMVLALAVFVLAWWDLEKSRQEEREFWREWYSNNHKRRE